MPRRADPRRIHEAKAAGVTECLVSELGMPRDTAERWVAAWEAEAVSRGLSVTDPDY